MHDNTIPTFESKIIFNMIICVVCNFSVFYFPSFNWDLSTLWYGPYDIIHKNPKKCWTLEPDLLTVNAIVVRMMSNICMPDSIQIRRRKLYNFIRDIFLSMTNIWNGPYEMDHMKWTIWNGPYDMARNKTQFVGIYKPILCMEQNLFHLVLENQDIVL